MRSLLGIGAWIFTPVLLTACSDDGTTAKSFVDSQANSAHAVVVSVHGVQQATDLYTNDPGPSTAVSFQQLLSTTKNTLTDARQSLGAADKPADLSDDVYKMENAIDELTTAIDSDRAFVDDEKPSDLADFGTHWKSGRVSWNEAVTKIWNAAGEMPPTVNAN